MLLAIIVCRVAFIRLDFHRAHLALVQAACWHALRAELWLCHKHVAVSR
jgi:hypothetical protein